MLDNPLIATACIFALIAVGEWLSIVSKARIPMLLTAMLGFLIMVWTGIFPEDILEKSQLAALGTILIAPAILHMGTMIPLVLLKSQIKAVLIALGGVIVAGGLILLIVPLVYDYPTAVAGVGPISGGVIALLITSEKFTELGLTTLVIIPALIVAFQGVAGMPLALNFMRKYAKDVLKGIDDGTFTPMEEDVKFNRSQEQKNKLSLLKTSDTVKLFFIFVGAALAVLLGELTPIHYSLWSLAIGIIGLKLNIFEPRSLEKANSFTLTIVAIIFVVIGTMAGVTPQQVLDNLPPVILILVIGTIGIMIGGWIMSRLVKWNPFKGMPVALTALFGFPGDFILCEEVSRSIGRNKEEEKLIFNELLAPMLIGGFTTVTVASVVIAGIFIETL